MSVHDNAILKDMDRSELIRYCVINRNAFVSRNGALVSWTRSGSTGRSPRDTYLVKDATTKNQIDWKSPSNNPITPNTFEMIWQDAKICLQQKEMLYESNRVIGADPCYALPVKTISDNPLTILFTYNMFREGSDIKSSLLHGKAFELLVLPNDKLSFSKYSKHINSDMAIAADLSHNRGVVIGSAYMGSVKKLMFTVMNYFLPVVNVLPLHCSANESKNNGDTALFLGLSGTGKTTLSATKDRALLGDDEHGWSENGIFNFENGCYAKMVSINPVKEAEIYNAVMHKETYTKHGAIVENAMMYPDGVFDFCDERLTPNSRASYPLKYLTNIKSSSCGGHPKIIIFLTADANGVLPPAARLSVEQAKLWYLMGYTSKLAGTETGIIEPKSVFSRFFGEPFMPCNPDIYANMFGDHIERYKTEVFLINTGWTGGPYGHGKRFDIGLTRRIVDAALSGELLKSGFRYDERFHLNIPCSCEGVSPEIFDPARTWPDEKQYNQRADQLATEFAEHFIIHFQGKVDEAIKAYCPGM